MTIDTDKASIRRFSEQDNIVLVDIYADGELLGNDMNSIHNAIEQLDVQIPVDTICVKSGKNYLSDDAVEYSNNHNCLHDKIVYVIKHMMDIHLPNKAQATYFKNHLVDYCASVDDAYHLLKKSHCRLHEIDFKAN